MHGPDPAADVVATLAAEYWDAFLESSPLYATTLGDRRYDDRMADATPEGRAAVRSRYAGFLARAATVDAATLDGNDRITLSTLRETLASDIAELDTGLADWTVDPLDGTPVDLLNVPAYQAVETPEDGARMIARWRAMGPFVDARTATLRQALADGRVASRPPVERTIGLLADLFATPLADWTLLGPATADGVARWPAGDRERFAAALEDAVATVVRPALERFGAALRDEILPAARAPEHPGIGHLPGGREAYRRLIRVHTSLDLEPEELHAVGLAEIERIDREIEELSARTIRSVGLADALERLRRDPALSFDSAEQVRAVAEDSLARAQAAVPAWFGRLPAAPCVVVEMEAHEQEHSTIAYYRPPAADGSRPGQYFLNTSAPETRPRYEAEALAFHEAVPGHHLQIAIGQELPGLPAFRRHLGTTAFFEGWALYAERLADEMGLYGGDLDRIGMLSFDAWRAARLVVDTGLHALDWTRDQAITFMVGHTALARNNIANEVDRYIVWPGQALAYKTGQLEMLRLRRLAEGRLGSRFDVRGFHDAVLGQGALPLTTLAGVVEDWVDGVVDGAGRGS